MRTHDRTMAILGVLRGLRGLDPLKQLFWSELNYDRVNQPISRGDWTDKQRSALAEDPTLFAGAGDGCGFQVIYCRLASDRLLITPERTVVSKLQPEHPYALFVFSNRDQDRWHFVNVKYEPQATSQRRRGGGPAKLFRRITIGPEERLRTASERIAMLDVAGTLGSLFGVSPLDIQKLHDEAFDVEAVTKQFFEGYKKLFKTIQDDLTEQTGDAVWAHDYALQFLNRLMFLYFVQRKRWLGDETEFLKVFWEAYQDSGQPRDTFFPDWLSVLFFEAFNNCYTPRPQRFPTQIHEALCVAPYLNGGLFRRNRLDTNPPKPFSISDATFEQTFKFMESYNFTIAEDSPVDQEVAVDPEMIGKVYESLVNVSSEADERGDAGIFYTPRTEIDLMCRLALVDNLANHLGPQHKNLLYEVVFALEPEDKEAADSRVQAAGIWDHINDRLRETTVVDPACGSGSFLVGMLHVLDDLQARAARHLGTSEDPYDRKKRIIGQSLYGVDVMEWACHVAELRLWLALIIDADIDTTAAHVRREPLLPHFSFKIRCGDSLVQEVGGVNMAHLKGSDLVPPPIKRKITRHKLEKLRFYNNDDDREYATEEQVKQAELLLFREILDGQDKAIEQQVTQINQRVAGASTRTLDGTLSVPKEMRARVAEWQQQVQELEDRRERLRETRQALQSVHDVPFVWDIAFVEVFEGDEGGFDIVVGNPPYVRQEKIADPHLREADFNADKWREQKKLYKAKLARSVYQTYPGFFGRDPERPSHKINAKSDLYCYFYFHGLSLLNPQGSFAFVTSNSWLDVGYGADLQEFLLRNCHVKMVIDNQVRRTFADADVNTVIVLFSAPGLHQAEALKRLARFVMFTVPFDQAIDPVIFQEIEEVTDRRTLPDYRIYVATQQQLLDAGCGAAGDADEEEESTPRRSKSKSRELIRSADYRGDKWGGKYLRAPDIYWRILERGKDKLVRLGDIADVRRGFTTGANEFFYVTVIDDHGGDLVRVATDAGTEHDLPRNVLVPAIVRPGNVTQTLMTCETADYHLVCIPGVPPNSLPDSVREYLRWGEEQGFSRHSTLRSRRHWYCIQPREPGWVLTPMVRKRRALVGWNEGRLQVDHNLFEVLPKSDEGHRTLAACLLSTLTVMQAELFGRANLGQGALKTEGVDIALFFVLNPASLDDDMADGLSDCMQALGERRTLMVYDDVRTRERRELDDVFLRAAGFDDPNERRTVLEELQDTTCRMVWARLAKPGNSRESRQTYDEWLATGQPFGADVEDDEDE